MEGAQETATYVTQGAQEAAQILQERIQQTLAEVQTITNRNKKQQ
jgi:hypothetical protein